MVVGHSTIVNLFMIMASHSNLLVPHGEGLGKPTPFYRLLMEEVFYTTMVE
jgi:hypothetical protein